MLVLAGTDRSGAGPEVYKMVSEKSLYIEVINNVDLTYLVLRRIIGGEVCLVHQ